MRKRTHFDDCMKIFEKIAESVEVDGQEIFRQLYSQNYPICNIKTHTETEDVVLEIALAGVDPDNVSVKQKSVDGRSALVIEYTKENQESDEDEKFHYVKRSIAQRAFKSYFEIPNRHEVAKDGIVLVNGLLTITMKKKEVEESDEVTLPIKKTVKADYR